jgi:hypothetical protein
VCISDGSATSAGGVADADGSGSSKRPRAVCDSPITAVLRDDRILAHDDGEGRPLRYMSLYGGMVTNML